MAMGGKNTTEEHYSNATVVPKLTQFLSRFLKLIKSFCSNCCLVSKTLDNVMQTTMLSLLGISYSTNTRLGKTSGFTFVPGTVEEAAHPPSHYAGNEMDAGALFAGAI